MLTAWTLPVGVHQSHREQWRCDDVPRLYWGGKGSDIDVVELSWEHALHGFQRRAT